MNYIYYFFISLSLSKNFKTFSTNKDILVYNWKHRTRGEGLHNDTLRLRLGLDQLAAGNRCLTHGCDFDSMRHHALSCKNLQGAIHTRHDLIRVEIFSQCLVLDRDSQLIQRNEWATDEQPMVLTLVL